MGRSSDEYGVDWVRRRIREAMFRAGLGPGEVGRGIGVTSQRISQITGRGTPASIELIWQIVALLDGREDLARFSRDEVLGTLNRLVIDIGPATLHALSMLDPATAKALISKARLARPAPPRPTP